MAKKTGGRDFTPGNKAAVGHGRPKFPEDVKRARKLNAVEVARMIDTFFYMPPLEIEAMLASPDTTVLEQMIGAICIKAAKNADHFRLNFLFDRCVGKVSEKIKVTLPKPTVIKRANGEAIVLGHEAEIAEEDEE